MSSMIMGAYFRWFVVGSFRVAIVLLSFLMFVSGVRFLVVVSFH